MMRWMYACLVIGLVLLAAPVAGQIPDAVTVSTDTAWLTAGSGETAAITVNVTNSTPATGVGGVRVELSVDGTDGSITPAKVVTAADGKATARFRPGTKSGTARITATVLYEGLDEPLTDSVEQHIDHAAPYRLASLWYNPEVIVGETTDIVLRMEDRYGNPVDSRRVAETVTFMVGSPAGGARFEESGSDKATVEVDETGNATATLCVDMVAGENIVYIGPPASAGPGRYITITAAGSEPAGIDQTVSPDADPPHYPELPLGGEFTITYALYDGYGNPAGDREIRVDIRPISGSLTAGGLVVKTNSQGKAQITYTSRNRAGVAEIVATAVDNSSVSCMKKVGFYSSTPVEMLITAVPGTIASRDIKEDIVSVVRAKVIDSKGNGVRNETVSFVITDVDNRTFPMSRVPEISNGTLTSTKGGTPIVATTDEEGIATIYFHPGAFTNDYDMATGSVAIQATWQGNNAATTVEFRNYPYLSVNVTVDPEVVKVNDSVTVTIQLIGDGYALQPDPIDVVLVIDRSGSMDTDDVSTDVGTDVNTTRMAAAKTAASTFIGQMNPDRDQIGLVSFSSSTTVDYELSDSFDAVNTSLNSLSANGATQLRRGIYEAIRMQNESSHDPDAIKAVVIMTDGEWNYDGSPIAHGTGYPEDSEWAYRFNGSTLEPDNYRYYDGLGGTLQSATKWYWSYNYSTDGEFTNQNMSRFASDNGVRLYTITFACSPNDTVRDTMNLLATSTGGFYEHAQSGAELTDVYKRIAGELKTAAGVNTTMNLEFGTVMVNSTPTSDVFEYEHLDPVSLDPVSTRMIKYWTDNKTTIWGPVCENQGTDWQGDKILSFDVGDIYLNQTWETTFRLKVLKEGNIDIFGDGSVIRFNGTEGESEVGLPHTFITARLNLTETDVSAAQIELTRESLNTDDPGILVPTWSLNYTGNRSVTQKILYQFSSDNIFWSGTWHEADTLYHPAGTNVNGTYSTTLNLGEKEGWYKIRVFAQEITLDNDGASDEITWNDPVEVGTSDRAYIRIS